MTLRKFGSVALLIGWCAAALGAMTPQEFLSCGTYRKSGSGAEEIILDGTKDSPPLSIVVSGGSLRINQKSNRARSYAELTIAKGAALEFATTWSSDVKVTDAVRGEGELRFPRHTSGSQPCRRVAVGGQLADFTGRLSAEGTWLTLTPSGDTFGGSITLTMPKKKGYMAGLSIPNLASVTLRGQLELDGGVNLEIGALPLTVGRLKLNGPVEVDLKAAALEGEPLITLLSGKADAATAAKLRVPGFKVAARGDSYVLAERLAGGASASPVATPETPVRAPGTFSLLSWNVYQQGTQQKGGYEMIISELVRLKPDLAVLVEVRNYGKKDWLAQVAADLKARGETYYTHWSEGAGVLSRTPFEDAVIWPGPRGNVRKAKTVIEGHSVVLYAGHLDDSYCAYYKAYPYAGKQLTETERAAAVTDILKSNVTSDRDNMAYAFLNDARTEFANGSNILFCGDFNETSHLDWTEETKHLRSHNGFVIPWTVSMALAGDGYTDAYRKAFPNPVTHPGNTYPSAMPGIDPKRIAWDKNADERERIDFIHYKGKEIALKEICVYGPRDSVGYGKLIREDGQDVFLDPVGPWPSDHKGLWAVFSFTNK